MISKVESMCCIKEPLKNTVIFKKDEHFRIFFLYAVVIQFRMETEQLIFIKLRANDLYDIFLNCIVQLFFSNFEFGDNIAIISYLTFQHSQDRSFDPIFLNTEKNR